MILLLIFAFFLSFVMGFLLINSFFHVRIGRFSLLHFLVAVLSIGFGCGLTSLVYCISLWALNPSPPPGIFLKIEVCLFLLLSAFYLLKSKKENLNWSTGTYSTDNDSQIVLPIVFCLLLGVSIACFVYISYRNPHGGWDAWTIWNMHSKFIMPGESRWRNLFSDRLLWSHPDYPLLIPGFIARSWGYIGKQTTLVPVVLAFIFTFGNLGLLYSIVRIFKGKNLGALAGITLLGTTVFLRVGVFQLADIPTAFFLLSTLILFLLHDRFSPEKSHFLFLAGVSLGLAGWTKNEGLLAILAMITARLIAGTLTKSLRERGKELISLGQGLLPLLAVIVYFKIKIAPANDIIANLDFQMLEKLLDVDRYAIVLEKFAKEFFVATNGMPIVLLIFVILLGIKIDGRDRISFLTLFIFNILMLVGYILIYVITPHPVEWHLETSIRRLFCQLLPSIILTLFVILRRSRLSPGL